MTTLLALSNDISDELSLGRPTSLIGNTTSDTAPKILRHTIRTIRQLSARYDWDVLRREKTFTTVGALEQTSSVPTDFLRFVQGTMFNRTRTLPVNGPLTAMEWQEERARQSTTAIDQFIMRGGALLMTPIPSAGQTVAYEYITKNIGTNVSGTALSAFTADTDEPYLDDELIILGAVWRYRKAEGTDYSEEFREYEMRFNDMTKMDGGRRVLDMSGAPRSRARGISATALTGQDMVDGTLN